MYVCKLRMSCYACVLSMCCTYVVCVCSGCKLCMFVRCVCYAMYVFVCMYVANVRYACVYVLYIMSVVHVRMYVTLCI